MTYSLGRKGTLAKTFLPILTLVLWLAVHTQYSRVGLWVLSGMAGLGDIQQLSLGGMGHASNNMFVFRGWDKVRNVVCQLLPSLLARRLH